MFFTQKVIGEVADSRTAGIFIRDTACFHCDSMNYDPIRVKPTISLCSKIRGKLYRRMHELKMQTSVLIHFKNQIESMVMKEERFLQSALSLFDYYLSAERGFPGTQHLFLAHFTTFACACLTLIFSDFLTIGYASFEGKKYIDPVIFSLTCINKVLADILKLNICFNVISVM